MPRLVPIAFLFALWSAAALAVDAHDTLMLAEPDISERHITFIYDGDVWVANRDGSSAYRLTTAEGQESRPHFSPDGASIAFSGNYDGNIDVYVVPIAGGSPKRLTWHSADDFVEGFDPKGRIVFSSQSDVQSSREAHLFTIDPKQAFPERLPIPRGVDADVSPDGRAIAYAQTAPQAQWKAYRGGTASRIAIMSFADQALQKIPQPPERCNDVNPMWIGGKLYFDSDRNGEFNLHSFDPASGEVRQLTSYRDFPVVNASAGDGKIIFEQAGHLLVFDPATATTTTLHVAVASDLRETRPRRVSNVDYVRNVSPSPGMDQVALEYRGEIVTVGAQKGAPIRDLTQSPGANDRSPAWSPGGGKIAWFSDESDDYALYVADRNGTGKPRRIAIDGGSGFYSDLKWSPDEKRLSFLDSAYSLFVLELESGRAQRISDNEYFGHTPFISHNWSPDSQWLAYTENSNGLIQTVYVYSIAQRKSTRITDGLTEVSEPVFDRNGRYLYVIASDQAGPVKDWFSLASLDLTFTHSLYAIVLRKGDPSPLPLEGEIAASAPAGAPEQPAPASAKGTTIDFDGIGDRIVPLPTGGATLRGLQVGKSGELYYLWTPATPAINALNTPGELKRFVMKDRTAKTLLAGVDAYFVSADGEKVLVRQGKSLKIAPAGGEIKPESATAVPIEDVSVLIDPRAEWRQILREAWRLNRDFFYAPNYHGVDWNAVWKKYEPFLDHAATRSDVGRIMAAMVSELRVGHSFSTKGESIETPPNVGIGLLGADFEVADGRYRFRKVYGGLDWRPGLRAPLRAPGISVANGEYLLAVDGKPLTSERNVYSAFENMVEKPVEISVGPRADGQGARTLKVVPIASERELRYVDWVEGNIRKVDAATGGRVAYVHVPDTSVAGHASFKRYFFPQSQKEALILDDRNNGGGFVADYYIDILRKQPVIRWATRYGKDLRTPRAAIYGPKVMIINEGAGSGGDLLPWMFHKLQLGPIVGTRTWGGLVGNLGIHTLMDGGTITAPNIAGWTPEDGWVIENVGVPPDVEVEDSPQSMLAGRDPQLEKAIEVALQALKEHPSTEPKRPAYPNRVTP
ncbi:MAG TPA: PDZ domain-containing protein [Steroidobacteraceae bacterium]|nr:PDZ domain-containing protein [Steroidobacteraceae bacterium]